MVCVELLGWGESLDIGNKFAILWGEIKGPLRRV